MNLRLVLLALFLPAGNAVSLGRRSVTTPSEKKMGMLAKHTQLSRAEGSEGLSLSLRETSVSELMETMTMDEARNIVSHLNATKASFNEIMKQASQDSQIDRKVIERAREMINEMMEESQMKRELEEVRCMEFERKQLSVMKELEGDIAFVNSEAAAARAEVLKAQEVISVTSETKLPMTRAQLWGHHVQCAMDTGALKQQLAVLLADIEAMKAVLGSVCVAQPAGSAALLGITGGANATTLRGAQGTNSSFDLDGLAVDGSIVQCVSCSQPVAWLKHSAVSPVLASLKSPFARKFLEKNLLDEFYASADDQIHKVALAQNVVQHYQALMDVDDEDEEEVVGAVAAVAVTTATTTARPPMTSPLPKQGPCNEQLLGKKGAGYRGCQAKSKSGHTCQKWSEQMPNEHPFLPSEWPQAGLGDHSYCRNPDGKDTVWCYTTNEKKQGERSWEYCEPKKQLKENTGTTARTCVQAPSCKLAKPQCSKLRDRFLVILSAMLDNKAKLMDELAEVERECKEVKESYEATISTLESQVKEEQTSLAAATMSIQENQQQSDLSSSQHKDLTSEYERTMHECCENKNGFSAEVCALSKIRGELYKQQKIQMTIKDCEVSAWVDAECSVSCGGGKQLRTRSPIVMTDKGTKCPPMSMTRSCSLDKCPIDCTVADWSEWSSCTAECGGGVQTRARDRVIPADNGGEPCPEQSETRGCNVQACNADCVLGDWGDWGLCSKACSTGREQRTKKVVEEHRGTGVCVDPESPHRMGFRPCNTWKCEWILPVNRSTLKCNAKMDLLILLDGSGSLGEYGWGEFKNISEDLVEAMESRFPQLPSSVNVGFMLYSGPDNGPDLDACTGGVGQGQGKKLDVEKQCGIQWISKLTDKVPDVATKVEAMTFPKKTTLTSMALAEARNELINGRPDANSVVLVITDGKPMSPLKTALMSAELKKQARLVWVPVGPGVTDILEDMKTWASQPWEDNLVHIDNFASLALKTTTNNIISSICPRVY